MARTGLQKASENLPATEDLESLMDQSAGEGVSFASEDRLTPIVYLLQPLSPQVNRQRQGDYIQGAEAGDIWLRSAVPPIIKGTEGMPFQPCYFSKDWVEWVPRESGGGGGGGFVGRSVTRPADAKETADPRDPNKRIWTRGNNVLMETRYHTGLVLMNGLALPYVIPMTSTGHTASKQWMTTIGQQRTKSGKTAPSFSYVYRIKSKQRTNKKGTWATWDIAFERKVTAEEILRGQALFKEMTEGLRGVEQPVHSEDVAADDAF